MVDRETVIGWRGHEVIDREGQKIGKVTEVYLDRETDEPEWVTVTTGLFGTRQTFVPIRDAVSEGETVRVAFDKAHVKEAPNVDAEGQLSQQEEAELYRHYGVDYGRSESGTVLPESGGERGSAGEPAAGGRRGEGGGPEQGADAQAAAPSGGPGEGRPADASGEQDVRADREGDQAAASGQAGPATPPVPETMGGAGGPDQGEQAGGELGDEVETRRVGREPAEAEGAESSETRLRLKKYVVKEEVRIPVEREEVEVERDEG